jgi:Zn-dependent protease
MNEAEVLKIAASLLALVIAVVGHEIMHGWVAYRFGDRTAKAAGRLSINPLVHIDPVGTLLVPGILYATGAPFLFGWAKPVPVDMHTVLRNGGIKGAVSVDLAGVTFNFVLAALAATLLPAFAHPDSLVQAFFALFLMQTLLINLILGVFNLWPIPPLDGSQALRHIAMGLGWKGIVEMYDRIYPYGMIILMIILFTPLSQILFMPVGWLAKLLLF